MRIIFVCGGNTCRSPMAAAFAQAIFGPRARIDTAGIFPHGQEATADAIAVVRDRTGFDLRQHRPRGVQPEELRNCNYIIAMDSYVASRLRQEYNVSEARLITWDIDDPYLRGRQAYERCADQISEEMNHLTQIMAEPSQLNTEPESHASPGPDIVVSLTALSQDLVRWKAELQSGEIRGTLLHGIAKKAVDSFEEVFRACARRYRTLVGEDQTAPGKPFERFTLGELINYMAEHDALLTQTCRRTRRGSALLKNRRLMTAGFRKSLDKISAIRNCLHHRPTEFAPNPKALRENSGRLLELLASALTDPFFGCAAADTDVKRNADP